MQKLLQVFKPNFLKNLITALLIVVPLYPKFPAIRIPGIYVSIRLEDFLILFTLLMFFIPLLSNIKEVLSDNVSKAILIFLTVGLISVISGVFITQTAVGSIALLHLFRRIEYFSMFFVGFVYMKLNKDVNIFEYLIKVLLIINFLILLYGLGQRYFNFPVIITQNEEYSKGIALSWVPGSHINSTFAGHYDLASYLVLTVPIFIAYFFVVKGKFSKIIIALSVCFAFWLFSSAVSRISIVSFLGASALSLLLLKKYKEILVVIFISVLAFGFSPDLRARYGRIIEVVREKISSIVVVYADEGEKEVFEDRSTSIRLVVEWPRAIRAFYKNPLLGTGYSSITLATDNDYLRALGETGILGLASFILVLISLFKVFRKVMFKNDVDSVFIAGFVGSSVGILVTALFIDIFEASKFATIYWMFAGLVVGKIVSQSKSKVV